MYEIPNIDYIYNSNHYKVNIVDYKNIVVFYFICPKNPFIIRKMKTFHIDNLPEDLKECYTLYTEKYKLSKAEPAGFRGLRPKL